MAEDPGFDRGPNKVVAFNRRDFLKLAAAAASLPFITELGRILRSPKVDGRPFPESGDPITFVEKQRLLADGMYLRRHQALTDFFPHADRNIQEYLEVRYEIDEHKVDISQKLKQNSGITFGDIANIVIACANKEVDPTPIVRLPDRLDQEPVVPSKKEISNAVIAKGMVGELLDLGTTGHVTLKRIGVDPSHIAVQEALYKKHGFDSDLITNKGGIILVRDMRRPKNSIVMIGNDAFALDASRTDMQAEWSIFILDRLRSVIDENPDLSRVATHELVLYESWLYSHFRDKAANRDSMTSEHKQGVKSMKFKGNDLGDFYNDTLAEIWSNRQYPPDSFISRTRMIIKDFNRNNPGSGIRLDGAWTVSEFATIIDGLSPGVRSMFHTKRVNFETPRTYEAILRESLAIPNATSNDILETTRRYQGNLFLERIADRRSSDADTKISRSDRDPKTLMFDILNGNLTLKEYADIFFGKSRTVIMSDGKIMGQIVTEKIAEPVIGIPPNVIAVLRAVEGENWLTGGEYLTKFALRNIKAKFTGDPESGASTPEMTMFEALFPGPFDKLSSIGSIRTNEYPFRRTDLYGERYLRSLYVALRDGKMMPELYEFGYLNSPMSAKDPEPTIFNRLCSKLEAAKLTQDFISYFGDDILIDLLAQYVPIGSAKGLQLYGLETGANYLFGKSLNDLNDGQVAILIGMIAAPIKYGPQIFDGKDWKDNSRVTKDRALTVARLCAQKGGFDVEKMISQIEETVFVLKIKRSWTTTFNNDQLNDLSAKGALSTRPVFIGSGIGLLSLEEVTRLSPDIVSIPLNSPDQVALESLVLSSIKERQVSLDTIENSPIAEVLQGASEIISNLGGGDWKKRYSEQIAEYANFLDPHVGFKLDFNGKNPYKVGTARYDLHAYLTQARGFEGYECGQLAIVLNCLIRIKLGLSAPQMLEAGNVDNWVNVIRKQSWKTGVAGYYNDGRYEVKSLNAEVNDPGNIDRADLFEVGDMVVAWVRSGGGGHVSTVINKGLDSNERHYIEVLDSNYEGTGQFRRQVILSSSIPDLFYPGNAKNIAVIRPVGVDHGSLGPRKDSSVVDNSIQIQLDDKDFVLPAYRYNIEVDGLTIGGKVPGLAISKFNKGGYVSSFDQTGVLGTLPIMFGSAIKPFIYTFLITQGSDVDREVLYSPVKMSSDGEEIWVANRALQMMNLNPHGKTSLSESLPCGFDVPFLIEMQDYLNKHRDGWQRFQNFMDYFGIPLSDYQGDRLTQPFLMSAIGLDVYAPNIDRLGYALSALLNNNSLPSSMVEASKKMSKLLFDKEIVANKIIRGRSIFDMIQESSPNSAANANAVIHVGDGQVLFNFRQENDYSVRLDRNPDGSVGTVIGVASAGQSDNMRALNRRAQSLGVAGFIDLMLKV